MCPSRRPAVPAAKAAIPVSYRLAPASTLEMFAQEAIIFLSETETFVTVNHPAADLFAVMQAALASRSFDRLVLTDLLLRTYEIDTKAAVQAADRVLAAWTACGILTVTSSAEALPAEREMST